MAKRASLTTPGARALYSKAVLDANFSALNVNVDNYLHLRGVAETPNSMLNDFDMGGFEIINSVTPSAPNSLATKGYVDQIVVISSTIGTIGSLVVDADGDTKVETEASADIDRLDLMAASSAGAVAGIQIVGDDTSAESLANPSVAIKKHVTMTAGTRIFDSVETSYIELGATTKFVQAAATVLDLSIDTILASQNIEMAVGKKIGDLDGDTYIIFNQGSDDDTFRVYAGGVEQLVITSTSVSIGITGTTGSFAIGGSSIPSGATKVLQMPQGTTGSLASDLIDNEITIYGQVVTGVESKLNFDFKTGASTKATVELGEDCVFPNDASVGNDLTVTGDLSVTLTSALSGGGSLAGTFTGAPTLSGAVIFSGAPSFTGLPVFSNASGLQTDDIVERTSAAGVLIDNALIKDGGFNYGPESGVADAYVVTLAQDIGAYTEGMAISFQPGNNNTGASTVNVNGNGAQNIKLPGGEDPIVNDIVTTQIVEIVYDGANFVLKNPAPLSSPSVSVRQTALTGAVTNGVASFISAGTGLAADLEANPVSLVLAFAAGFNPRGEQIDHLSVISADTASAWSSLDTSDTLYLFVDRNTGTGALTFNFITTVPSYGYVHPGSPATDDHSFLIQEMKMYRWTGSVWEEKQRVFLGEVDTDGSGVTAARTYALRGEFEGLTAALAISTQYTFNSQIGMPPRTHLVGLENISAEDGYAIGDRVWEFSTNVPSKWAERLTSGISTTNAAMSYAPKGGGAVTAITLANWKAFVYTSKGW